MWSHIFIRHPASEHLAHFAKHTEQTSAKRQGAGHISSWHAIFRRSNALFSLSRRFYALYLGSSWMIVILPFDAFWEGILWFDLNSMMYIFTGSAVQYHRIQCIVESDNVYFYWINCIITSDLMYNIRIDLINPSGFGCTPQIDTMYKYSGQLYNLTGFDVQWPYWFDQSFRI